LQPDENEHGLKERFTKLEDVKQLLLQIEDLKNDLGEPKKY